MLCFASCKFSNHSFAEHIRQIISDTSIRNDEYAINLVPSSKMNYFNENTKIVYTYNQTEQSLFLYDDTLFILGETDPINILPSEVKKFSGKIKVFENILVKDQLGGERVIKQVVGYFVVNNGLFEGKQLYKVNLKDFGGVYIYSEIVPMMDVVKYIHYQPVGSNSRYDFTYDSWGKKYYYKYILDNSRQFLIDLFWPNGNQMFKSNYIYSSKQYIFSEVTKGNLIGNKYDKIIFVDTIGNKQLFHADGSVAFSGLVKSSGQLGNGDYKNFDRGTESIRNHFFQVFLIKDMNSTSALFFNQILVLTVGANVSAITTTVLTINRKGVESFSISGHFSFLFVKF